MNHFLEIKLYFQERKGSFDGYYLQKHVTLNSQILTNFNTDLLFLKNVAHAKKKKGSLVHKFNKQVPISNFKAGLKE